MHHKIQDVDKVKEKLKDEVMTSQRKVSYIKVVNKEYGTFFTFLNKAKENFINGIKEKPIFMLENVVNMNPIVSNITNKVEYEGVDIEQLEEGGLGFTLKNIDLIMANMLQNCKKTGNFKAIRPRLLKLVARAKSLEDIRYLRQDLGTAPYTMKKLGENNPSIKKQCDEHSKWLDDVYRTAINDRAKEIRNTLTESAINYNEEDLQDHHGIAAVILDKQGRILVQDHVKFDFWTIPVGKVKHDETVEEGLLTEMREELNIRPTKYYELFSTKKTYDRNGIPVTVNQHVFFITEYEGSIRNNEPEKHRSIKWMTVDEINKQSRVSDATKNYLEYAKNNNKADKELIPVYVLLTYTNSLMAKAIKFVTHQPYSHAGISLDSSMKHIFTYGRKEAKDVCKFTDENIYDGALGAVKDSTPYSLYVTFFEKPQFETLKSRIESIKNDISRHGYSYKGLINFALGKETTDDHRMFCSQFVADVIKAGDSNRVKKHTSRYSPSDLSKVKGMHFVTKGILGNYNEKRVQEIVKKLQSEFKPNALISPLIESTIEMVQESIGDVIGKCVNCDALLGFEYIYNKDKPCYKCGKLTHTKQDDCNELKQMCENGMMHDFVDVLNETDNIDTLLESLDVIDDSEYLDKIRKRISALENTSDYETEKHLYIIIESTVNRIINNRLGIFNNNDTDTKIYTVEESSENNIKEYNVDQFVRKGTSLVKECSMDEIPVQEEGLIHLVYKVSSDDTSVIDNVLKNFAQVKAWKPMVPITSLDINNEEVMESYIDEMLRSINIDTEMIDIQKIK